TPSRSQSLYALLPDVLPSLLSPLPLSSLLLLSPLFSLLSLSLLSSPPLPIQLPSGGSVGDRWLERSSVHVFAFIFFRAELLPSLTLHSPLPPPQTHTSLLNK